jgi:hypothetical protein
MGSFDSICAASTKRARLRFKGLKARRISQGAAYSVVGGITLLHHENIIGFQTSEEDLMVEALPYVVGRDASMVLPVMKGSRRYYIYKRNSVIVT